jgi:hypothetical protein
MCYCTPQNPPTLQYDVNQRPTPAMTTWVGMRTARTRHGMLLPAATLNQCHQAAR